jgi:hypothetical protein
MAASGSNCLAFSMGASCVGSKRLFDASAEDGVTVSMLFDKEVLVVLAHNSFWLRFEGLAASSTGLL